MIPARLRTERAGIVAMAVLLAASLPILLVWGDGQWFNLDEWSFIANRQLPTIDGLFEDHNGHWVTIPLVLFRINFELFGLHTYVPYQVLVVVSHLIIAGLVHTVTRRAGVHAWIATVVLVPFVFLGAGWGNILFAFQITLNGSIIAGLVQLLLADRDGKWSRWDTLGVGVALLGLMTSAVMPAMSVTVGAFVLLRRGWRIAAGHTVPPAIVFLLWYVGFGGSEESDPHPWRIVQFVYHMLRATFEGIGGSALAGLGLALVAGLGLVTAVLTARRTGDPHRAAIPVGLVTGLLAFASLTGFNRSGFGADIAATAAQGRYVHICAALLLPLVAMGMQQLWLWRRPLVVIPIVLLALGLPDNIDNLRHRNPFTTGNRDQVTAVAHSDLLGQVPDHVRPIPFQDIRAGWLKQAVAAGEIPEPRDDLPGRVRLSAESLLAFAPAPTETAGCQPVEGQIARTLERGDRIVAGGPLELLVTAGDELSSPQPFAAGTTVTIQAGPVEVLVRGAGGAAPVACVVTGR